MEILDPKNRGLSIYILGDFDFELWIWTKILSLETPDSSKNVQ